MKIIPVIMSGGAGTRLWPLSTAERPKQFHALLGEASMIVETAKRFAGKAGDIEFLAPVFVAGERHGAILTAQLADAGIAPGAVVLEPVGRNTAATAVIAALTAQKLDEDALVLLCPADHVVEDPASFHAAIAGAVELARERIVTFGMEPTGPETGFGYIKQGERLGDGVFAIDQFREKPNADLAQSYLDEGGYSWNSGVFLYAAETMLAEFEALNPAILAGVRAAMDGARSSDAGDVLDAAAFGGVEAMAVDVAIMEKTEKGAVAPCSIGWADVGSWSEYWRMAAQDGDGNVLEGAALVKDGRNLLVRSEDGVHVSVAGVSDLMVIATKDAVLVAPRSRAQEVKALIPKDRKS